MTIPFFDGHNDTLLKLLDIAAPGRVQRFIDGHPPAHIDLPRAKQAGMVGGFFAMFPPPLKGAIGPSSGGGDGKLPPQLDLADAQRSTNAMAALLLQLERAGAVKVCRTAGEVRETVGGDRLATIFHIEGAEAIDPDLEALEVLYAAGLRSVGLVWSRQNIFATGVPFVHNADPDIGEGLTEAGKRLVKACDAMGVMIDLSHLNAAGFRDVAALSSKPLVATHSNVHAISPHARNLTDWQLAAIKESGGVVGFNYATGFLRPDGQMRADTEIEIMVRHVDALVAALGEDGVALGSDFDGALIPAAIKDVTGVPKLLDALLAHGFGEELVRKIALDNWLGLLDRVL